MLLAAGLGSRLRPLTDELPNKTRTALRTLLESFGRWRQALAGLPHTELAEIVLDDHYAHYRVLSLGHTLGLARQSARLRPSSYPEAGPGGIPRTWEGNHGSTQETDLAMKPHL